MNISYNFTRGKSPITVFFTEGFLLGNCDLNICLKLSFTAFRRKIHFYDPLLILMEPAERVVSAGPAL